MALPTINAAGNLTADPERRSVNGVSVCNFTLACTERRQDDRGDWIEGAVTFIRVTVWRSLADNVAASLRKGDAATACGKLNVGTYETKEGDKRTYVQIDATDVGVGLRYATAVPEKTRQAGARTTTSGRRVAAVA